MQLYCSNLMYPSLNTGTVGAAIYSAFRQQMTFNADTMTPSVALVFECMPLVRAFCQRGKHLTSTAKLWGHSDIFRSCKLILHLYRGRLGSDQGLSEELYTDSLTAQDSTSSKARHWLIPASPSLGSGLKRLVIYQRVRISQQVISTPPVLVVRIETRWVW